jgi:hypothetical protein
LGTTARSTTDRKLTHKKLQRTIVDWKQISTWKTQHERLSTPLGDFLLQRLCLRLWLTLSLTDDTTKQQAVLARGCGPCARNTSPSSSPHHKHSRHTHDSSSGRATGDRTGVRVTRWLAVNSRQPNREAESTAAAAAAAAAASKQQQATSNNKQHQDCAITLDPGVLDRLM